MATDNNQPKPTATNEGKNTSSGGPADKAMDGASEWGALNGPLLWALLGGGIGAGAGALFTNSSPDESSEERAKRRLMNALILGGMGAGAGYLISDGANALAVDPEKRDAAKQGLFSKLWAMLPGFGDIGEYADEHPWTTSGAVGSAVIKGRQFYNAKKTELAGKNYFVEQFNNMRGDQETSLKNEEKSFDAATTQGIKQLTNTYKNDPAKLNAECNAYYNSREAERAVMMRNHDAVRAELAALPKFNAKELTSPVAREYVNTPIVREQLQNPANKLRADGMGRMARNMGWNVNTSGNGGGWLNARHYLSGTGVRTGKALIPIAAGGAIDYLTALYSDN